MANWKKVSKKSTGPEAEADSIVMILAGPSERPFSSLQVCYWQALRQVPSEPLEQDRLVCMRPLHAAAMDLDSLAGR